MTSLRSLGTSAGARRAQVYRMNLFIITFLMCAQLFGPFTAVYCANKRGTAIFHHNHHFLRADNQAVYQGIREDKTPFLCRIAWALSQGTGYPCGGCACASYLRRYNPSRVELRQVAPPKHPIHLFSGFLYKPCSTCPGITRPGFMDSQQTPIKHRKSIFETFDFFLVV